jgi:hypothetical protein
MNLLSGKQARAGRQGNQPTRAEELLIVWQSNGPERSGSTVRDNAACCGSVAQAASSAS